MFFKQILREKLGCASYIIGDPDAGVCAVVDPHWTIDDYMETAQDRGLKITHIFETHVHADHISGNRKLKARTGAAIYLHRNSSAGWADRLLEDGDQFDLGAVRIKVIHAPGHTPESIVLAVSDSTRSEEPWLALTGDTLFIDDVGRPDLAGPQGAAELFETFQSKLMSLDPAVEVYPAHVAGSLCGRAMNLKTSSTIGYERRFNRVLQDIGRGRETFINNLTADLPLHSPSFEVIIGINRQGPPDRDLLLERMEAEQARRYLAGGAVALDVREAAHYTAGHLPGSINIPFSSGQLPSQVSWLVRPQEDLLLVAENPQQAGEAAAELSSVRATGRLGYLEGGLAGWQAAGGELRTTGQLSVEELQTALQNGQIDEVLDVREADEWQAGHLPDARNISYRQLGDRHSALDASRSIAVMCAGGFRSQLGASVLERYGFKAVYKVQGGVNAWRQAGLPLETGRALDAAQTVEG